AAAVLRHAGEQRALGSVREVPENVDGEELDVLHAGRGVHVGLEEELRPFIGKAAGRSAASAGRYVGLLRKRGGDSKVLKARGAAGSRAGRRRVRACEGGARMAAR